MTHPYHAEYLFGTVTSSRSAILVKVVPSSIFISRRPTDISRISSSRKTEHSAPRGRLSMFAPASGWISSGHSQLGSFVEIFLRVCKSWIDLAVLDGMITLAKSYIRAPHTNFLLFILSVDI